MRRIIPVCCWLCRSNLGDRGGLRRIDYLEARLVAVLGLNFASAQLAFR